MIALFGQPQQRGIDSEKGVNLQWIYVETTIKGGSFIPLVGAFAGGVKEKTKTLTVFMNQSGKVSSYDYSGGGFESSNGIQNDPESATNQTFVLKTPKQR